METKWWIFVKQTHGHHHRIRRLLVLRIDTITSFYNQLFPVFNIRDRFIVNFLNAFLKSITNKQTTIKFPSCALWLLQVSKKLCVALVI